MDSKAEIVKLIYWPNIPGRGEPIRWLCEVFGVSYVDVARAGDKPDFKAVTDMLVRDDPSIPPVAAPPIIQFGGITLSQTPNILMFIAREVAKVVEPEDFYTTQQHVLTALDMTSELHNVHHPISATLLYEDQKTEALKAAALFVGRLGKFLKYFEQVLVAERAKFSLADDAVVHMVGNRLGVADIALLYMWVGFRQQHAKAASHWRADSSFALTWRLLDSVKKNEKLAAYFASDKCMPFNLDGVFRNLPELDVEVA
jgi:glutathione S-transferase